MPTSKPESITVLAGGLSAEREVSLKSGAAVAIALREAGFLVTEIDPRDVDLSRYDWRQTDVAFIALHGTFGEDGTVQRLLDDKHVCYTGSGPLASQIAFSKIAAKERFALEGIPTPRWRVIKPEQHPDHWAAEARMIGFPLVVKPDEQGSSIGVTIVKDPTQLSSALEVAFRLGARVLLEQAIIGREWTVGLLDRRPLPPIQIGTPHEFFDYQAKYHADNTLYHFEAIPTEVGQRVVEAAVAACRVVDTRGVARVDVMVNSAGQPFVLEVNTIPGFTDHSLVPKAAREMGLSFGDLCRWCVESAWMQFHARQIPPPVFHTRSQTLIGRD